MGNAIKRLWTPLSSRSPPPHEQLARYTTFLFVNQLRLVHSRGCSKSRLQNSIPPCVQAPRPLRLNNISCFLAGRVVTNISKREIEAILLFPPRPRRIQGSVTGVSMNSRIIQRGTKWPSVQFPRSPRRIYFPARVSPRCSLANLPPLTTVPPYRDKIAAPLRARASIVSRSQWSRVSLSTQKPTRPLDERLPMR